MSKVTQNHKSSENEPAHLTQELAAAIDKLPLMEMIDSVQMIPMTQPDPNDSNATITWQANQLIDHLSVLAKLGNEDAIRALRDIGNSAARTLVDLGRKKESKDYPEKPSMFAAGRPPVVKLRGDFSTINKILAGQDAPAVQSTEKSRRLQSFHQLEASEFVVDVIDNLHWQDDRAAVFRNTFIASFGEGFDSNNKLSLTDPRERLWLMFRKSNGNGTKIDPGSEAANAEVVLHDTIRRKIEERLLRLAPQAASEAVLRVASESLFWPLPTSAIQEEVRRADTERERLRLGSGLPFRLKRKGDRGRPRDFKKGSMNAFALEYCIALLDQKRWQTPQTTEVLQRMRNRLDTLVNETLPAIVKAEIHGAIDTMKKAHALESRWRLEATFLPDFPAPEGTYGSDKVLEHWHRVAMLLAESVCRGDWDRYPWWPQWVMNRVRKVGKSGKKRSTKEAVSECLRRGITNIRGLEPDSP